MDIVTIDFETYYDKEYSLSKMTTESYVRDPRFEVIGVGVKVNDHPTDFYSGSNPGRFLKSLDYRDKAILCHNTAFDGFILSHHFGIRPKFWMDTMSMARPAHAMTSGVSLKALALFYSLGAKGDEVVNALGKRRADFSEQDMARYASYCVNDVDLTYQLFLRLRKGFPAIELRIIDLTLRMFTEPEIELNREVLERYLAAVITRKEELLNAVEGVDKADLMSNPKMAQLLTQLNVIPPTKISARTGKETLAFGKTDRAFLDLLDHPDERVQTLVAARLGVKSTLAETRATSLIGVSERGRLPIMLNYYGAHTGRFSGGDKMNLQNLPSGGALRESLQAPKGKMLVACDSAQIEARVVAYIADQGDLVQAFREGRDVYSEFATEVYGKPVSKADKLERFVGKTCILGLGYGMGGAKLKHTLGIGVGGIKAEVTEGEAQRIVSIYRTKNHKIATFWNRCNHALNHIYGGTEFAIVPHIAMIVTSKEAIALPNGMQIRYPILLPTPGHGYAYAGERQYRDAARRRILGEQIDTTNFTKIYGGKVTENIVQALARIVVAEQMVKIAARYKVVLQVHDEVVILCDEDDVENAKAFMLEVMSTPPSWAPDLPVSCEAHYGHNFGECK